jgi:hypothetical protein
MNPSQIQMDVLTHLVQAGGTGNVMEFLKYDASEFQKGFDLANDMQNLNYVKLLYSNFDKNLLVVELTLLGRAKINVLNSKNKITL